MGIYLLREAEEVLREKASETLSYAVLRRSARVDEWLGERTRELGRWSASFVLFEGLPRLGSPGRTTDLVRRDLAAFLDSLLEHNAVYESLLVTDPRGSVLVATRKETLEPEVLELLRELPAGTGKLSPVFRSADLGRPTLVAAHVVQDRGLESVGVLAGRVDLRQLDVKLVAPPEEPAMRFQLLDAAGGILARSGKEVLSPGRERFPLPIDAALVRSGVTAVPAGAFGPGEGALLVAVRPLDGPLPGFLVATLPESVAYRTLAASRRNLLASGIPLVLVAVALSVLLARQMLLPIRRLSEGARRMSAGDLDVRLPEAGRDEIAELTRAFNDMVRRVLEGRTSLEQARDELARSNAELQHANQALEELAITDGLTGLYNHRHFQETWEREIRLAQREARPVGLLMLDLDRFKDYNDRYGHTAGDEALRAVAECLRRGLRSSDLAFRYGGEELAAILPGCDKEAACRIAENVRAALRSLPRSIERPRPLTVSIGVASYPSDGTMPREILDRADSALYVAKSEGRDRVVAFRLRPSPPAQA
jgi:diguanylate cyclase (GGDEF)-like protein